MKPYMRIVHRWILALTPPKLGRGLWAEAQQIPAAAVACYFVSGALVQVNSQG